MKDFLIALLAGGIGIGLLAVGYRYARIMISLIGFISGIALGGAVASDMAGTPFLGTMTGILVGLVAGVAFALLAYFYYAFAIVVMGMSLGYWLGSEFILLLGLSQGVLSVTMGLLLGAAFGIAAVVLNLPKYVLMVATSIAGAVVTVGAILLLFQQIPLQAFSYATSKVVIVNSFVWLLVTIVLAGVGIAFQARSDRDFTLNEWGMGEVGSPRPPAVTTHGLNH
jgi:hypothetical protein